MNDAIRIDIRLAMSDVVGEAHGITPAELDSTAGRVRELHGALVQDRVDKVRGFYDLYKDTQVIDRVKAEAERFRGMGYENLVVLGIGGSALGLSALNTALNPPYYNLLDSTARGGAPRLFVMDNIDPVTFARMMSVCPPEKTLYNAISKSGETAETMLQLLIVMDALERAVGKAGVRDHLVITTSPDRATAPDAPPSLLKPVAEEYETTTFDIPVNVGGRFSVFSPVGLFPAAVLGMDIDGMVAGCAVMDTRCSSPDLQENPAYLCAALQYVLDTRKGKTMSVMMPYSDGLRDVADWYRQLWAESLGKKNDLDGMKVYVGQTPVKALGATDQHSQVQLYREGPNNKVFTVLEVLEFSETVPVPDSLVCVPDLAYLHGATMNELMAAELEGTVEALTHSQRPVIRISMPRINANTVAQLLYLLEVETAMAGQLYHVNAFDQPGVEEGKRIARRLMGGNG